MEALRDGEAGQEGKCGKYRIGFFKVVQDTGFVGGSVAVAVGRPGGMFCGDRNCPFLNIRFQRLFDSDIDEDVSRISVDTRSLATMSAETTAALASFVDRSIHARFKRNHTGVERYCRDGVTSLGSYRRNIDAELDEPVRWDAG